MGRKTSIGHAPLHCAQAVTPLSFSPWAVPLVSREIPLFGPDGSDTPGGPPVGAGSSGAANSSVVGGSRREAGRGEER